MFFSSLGSREALVCNVFFPSWTSIQRRPLPVEMESMILRCCRWWQRVWLWAFRWHLVVRRFPVYFFSIFECYLLTRSDSSSHCPNAEPHFFPKRMNFRQRFSAGWEQVTHIRLPKRRPMWWWQRTTTTALRKPSNATCCKEANMDWNSCWEGIRPFLSLEILWLKCEEIKNWWDECRFSWSFCAGFVCLNDVHVCHFCLNVGQVDWHELRAIWKVQIGRWLLGFRRALYKCFNVVHLLYIDHRIHETGWR